MVSGVAAVWLPVQDMKRAIDFYGGTLGLSVEKQDDDWAEVDANGLRVGLNARESEGARGDGGPVISFQPEGDIEQAKQELEGNGVEFPAEISDHPWGRIATFKDSEGNDLQLYAPPSQ
jgi:predicted enzyme related to lactoylglutathione lyase